MSSLGHVLVTGGLGYRLVYCNHRHPNNITNIRLLQGYVAWEISFAGGLLSTVTPTEPVTEPRKSDRERPAGRTCGVKPRHVLSEPFSAGSTGGFAAMPASEEGRTTSFQKTLSGELELCGVLSFRGSGAPARFVASRLCATARRRSTALVTSGERQLVRV